MGMGHSDMDLSYQVATAANALLRNYSGKTRAVVHGPSPMTLNHYVIILAIEWNGRKINATGTAKKFIQAFTKAISELGESVIGVIRNLPHRSGLAGGLCASPTVERAKAELVERDAFFYHYRAMVPFTGCTEIQTPIGTLLRYQLSSTLKGYHVVLITDPSSAQATGHCLRFTTAANECLREATHKAVAEYTHIHLMHVLAPERCKPISEFTLKNDSLADFHHAASRDKRNKQLFSILCKSTTVPRGPSVRQVACGSWVITKLQSPVRGFQFFQAHHAGLINLEFGKPEPSSDPRNPLYHPFW